MEYFNSLHNQTRSSKRQTVLVIPLLLWQSKVLTPERRPDGLRGGDKEPQR
jgi:hypothetical protein